MIRNSIVLSIANLNKKLKNKYYMIIIKLILNVQ